MLLWESSLFFMPSSVILKNKEQDSAITTVWHNVIDVEITNVLHR
jgi:hypothetical protein